MPKVWLRNGLVMLEGGKPVLCDDCPCVSGETGTGTSSGTFDDSGGGCVTCCDFLPVRWRVRCPIPAADMTWMFPPVSGTAFSKLEECRVGGTVLVPIMQYKRFLWNTPDIPSHAYAGGTLDCGTGHGYTVTDPASLYLEGDARFVINDGNVCYWEGCLESGEATLTLHGKMLEYKLDFAEELVPPFIATPYDVACTDCDVVFTARIAIPMVLQMTTNTLTGTGLEPCILWTLEAQANPITSVYALDCVCIGPAASYIMSVSLACGTVDGYTPCSYFGFSVTDACGNPWSSTSCGCSLIELNINASGTGDSTQCLGPAELSGTSSALGCDASHSSSPFLTGPVELTAV